jgi:hypothetical protein
MIELEAIMGDLIFLLLRSKLFLAVTTNSLKHSIYIRFICLSPMAGAAPVAVAAIFMAITSSI